MSCLTRRGYRIDRTDATAKYIEELTLHPEEQSRNSYNDFKEPVLAYRKTKSYIFVPRHYGYLEFGKPDYDKTGEGEPIDIKFNGSLRDYQLEVIDKTKPALEDETKRGGIWALGTGTGKTVISLYFLSEIVKRKTIILVHKEFLLDQWIERIEQFLPDARVGIIRQKKIEIEDKDIVIGMIQSISMKKYPKETFDSFGLLIIDECHYVCSKTFSKALFKIQPKYKLGLSATPDRKDGLTKLLIYHLGPIIHRMSSTILDPDIEFLFTKQTFTEEVDFRGRTSVQKLISSLTEDDERNSKIIRRLVKLCEENRKTIVFCHRVNHCYRLRKMLQAVSKFKGGTFAGKMKKEEKEEAKRQQVIFATYSMCTDAFDCPSLDSCIFATPKSDVVQATGRILRRKNENSPLVIDVVDNNGIFKAQYYKRRKWYKSKGYDFVNDKKKEVKGQKKINKFLIKK